MPHKENNFFEKVYRNAGENLSGIPWASLAPNDYLLAHLEAEGLVHDKKALVIGCGLGDDAMAIAEMGYETDAIDISPSAIELAKSRFGEDSVTFGVADIFDMPPSSAQKYDFVYEGLTIQSLPRTEREKLVSIICGLVARGGKLLVYAHGQEDEDDYGGPPWPLYKRDFDLFKSEGFEECYRKEVGESKPVAPFHCCVLYEK